MSDINYLDIKEFREFGYLQEVNRLCLHPLGLALEITIEEDGSEHLSGVWDYRDDPEGIYMDPVDKAKADRVETEYLARGPKRKAALGYIIQPVEC